MPVVSVVIPTYNSAEFVTQAVQSVLEQTYRHFEVIVIDDGSTDDTKEVLGKFDGRIKYFYQENLGPSAARNTGIKIARGSYACFLDSDDLWTPNKLAVQLAFMERNRGIGLLFSDHEEFDAGRVLSRSFLAEKVFRLDIVSQLPIEKAFMKLVIDNFISTPTVIVRTECFEKVGLFDESLRSVEDRDMWLRISGHFGIGCLPLILCRRRIHKFNISRDYELLMRGRIKVLEKNHRLFPNLAPTVVWNSLLADTYFQLGYILLAKDQRKEALLAGCSSLMHAVTLVIMKKSLSSYPWVMAIGLIPAGFLGWPVSRALWRTLHHLLRKSKQ